MRQLRGPTPRTHAMSSPAIPVVPVCICSRAAFAETTAQVWLLLSSYSVGDKPLLRPALC